MLKGGRVVYPSEYYKASGGGGCNPTRKRRSKNKSKKNLSKRKQSNSKRRQRNSKKKMSRKNRK